jgi:hypothetical protein
VVFTCIHVDRATYIVGNCYSRKIGEKSDEDNEFGADGLVDNDHGCDQVDLEM